jgi:hypothetical protein
MLFDILRFDKREGKGNLSSGVVFMFYEEGKSLNNLLGMRYKSIDETLRGWRLHKKRTARATELIRNACITFG